MQGRKLLMTVLAIGLGLAAYGQEKPKISRASGPSEHPRPQDRPNSRACFAARGAVESTGRRDGHVANENLTPRSAGCRKA